MNMLSPATLARESWFDLLDQRRFTIGSERWTAQVAGVHVAGFDTWIQLEFAEDQRRSMLLHLTPGTGIGAAVEAIRRSLQHRLAASPDGSPEGAPYGLAKNTYRAHGATS